MSSYVGAQVVPGGIVEQEDAEIFRPTTDGGDFLSVYDAQTWPQGQGHLSIYGDYARNPLEVQFDRGGEVFTKVVEDLGTVQLSGAFSLLDGLTVGARIPGYISSLNDVQAGNQFLGGTEANIGDIVANAKVRLIDPRDSGFGLAILPEITLPTGSEEDFAGTGELGYGGSLILFGQAGPTVSLGLNVGGVVRDDPVNDQLRYGAATNVAFTPALSGILELYGATDVGDPFGESRESPLDLVAALRARFGLLQLTFGGGPGLTRGKGSPDFRVFASIGMARPDDRMGPGPVLDTSSKSYGLADRDGDGRPSPGDVLEYRINLVNTGSAVATGVIVEDPVPAGTRYLTGSIAVNGVPQSDAVDGDAGEYMEPVVRFRIPELDVSPQDQPGLTLSFQVEIDPNITELVTIENQAAASSQEIERFLLPPTRTTVFPSIAERERVIVSPDKLELTEEIHFEFDKAVIRQESFPILNELADVLREYPTLQVRIEGHTDSVGTDSYNQRLSERRALSVRDFLVGAGISEDRLEWAGFGESRPIASNDTPIGRAKNRRTEFPILNPEALRDRRIETRDTDHDLAPESEPEWLKRGGTRPGTAAP